MSYLVSDLSKRAQEAESKLAELQDKLNTLSKTMGDSNEQKQDIVASKGLKFYYWDGLKNRGNFGQMLLAEAGIDYELINDGAIIATKCKCKKSLKAHGTRFDAFAPPFVEHNGHFISQTVPIQLFLGELSGLRPKSNMDNVFGVVILENVNDAITEISKKKDVELKEVQEFLNGRFQDWCEVLEKPLIHGKTVSKYYFDDTLTYVDVYVACFLDGLHELLKDKIFKEIIDSKHAALGALYQRVVNRPKIRAFLDQQDKEGKLWFPESFFGTMLKTVKQWQDDLGQAKVAA